MQSFARVLAVVFLSAFLATSSFAAPSTAALAARDVATPSPSPAFTTHSRRHMTNAQRMARGLPPNPPHRRHGRLVARVSPTPVGANSPAPTPQNAGSSFCTPRTGVIEITSLDGTTKGYLANVTTLFGQYGFSPKREDAMQVQALCDGERFDIVTVDPNALYPYIGGITGLQSISADLLPGSSNYAYLGGVTATLPGKPACSQDSSFTWITKITNTVESAIWSMDDSTGALTPHWVNSRGGEQIPHIAYSPSNNVLFFTGDITEFKEAVDPSETILEMNLTLVLA